MKCHDSSDCIDVYIAAFGKLGFVQGVFDLSSDLGITQGSDGAVIRVFDGLTRTRGGILHRLTRIVHRGAG